MLRIIHVFMLAAAIAAATPLFVTSAQTTSLVVTGSGKTATIDGRYAGAADVTIGGIARQAAVVVTFVEPYSEEHPGGAQAAMTTHTFDFGNGDSITTSERLIQAPTDDADRNSMHAELTMTAGTGVYANLGGTIVLAGTIELATGEATWSLDGRLEN